MPRPAVDKCVIAVYDFNLPLLADLSRELLGWHRTTRCSLWILLLRVGEWV
jgi:hypothetical protein